MVGWLVGSACFRRGTGRGGGGCLRRGTGRGGLSPKRYWRRVVSEEVLADRDCRSSVELEVVMREERDYT